MPKIVERLKGQLEKRGVKDAEGMAYALQNKAGNVHGNKLTAKGAKRQAMGAAGRAKDRAAKDYGGKPGDYEYDKASNVARKSGRQFGLPMGKRK
jgi:hypothetical protein